MTIYLIQGVLETSHYMGKTEKEKIIRLVQAETESEAEEKFVKHFADQTVEYATYYYANVTDTSEMIV